MNRSSVLVVIIGIALENITVSSKNIDSTELVLNSTSECETEREEFEYKVNTCAPKGLSNIDIFEAIAAYRNQSIDNPEFSRLIREYCSSLKIAINCSMEKVPQISSECCQNSRVQSLLNFMRIISRVETDICSESIIYDIANDDGYSCLRGGKLGRCLEENHEIDKHSLKDESVCAIIRTADLCIDKVFNDCENTGMIKRYGKQIINSLVDDFSCAQ